MQFEKLKIDLLFCQESHIMAGFFLNICIVLVPVFLTENLAWNQSKKWSIC